MNKRQLVGFGAVCAAALLVVVCSVAAGETFSPLSRSEVNSFLKELNRQGKVASFDPGVKEDKIAGGESEDRSFYLEGSPGSWYFLYNADINNDGEEEYILCSVTGSDGIFDIDSIYQERDGKLVDIFDEIKVPLRKLIREAENKDYDPQEGYSGLMQGSIEIEKEQGNVFFTLERITRRYEGEGFEEDFNPPQGYKFLWNDSGIELIEYLKDKVYKP